MFKKKKLQCLLNEHSLMWKARNWRNHWIGLTYLLAKRGEPGTREVGSLAAGGGFEKSSYPGRRGIDWVRTAPGL